MANSVFQAGVGRRHALLAACSWRRALVRLVLALLFAHGAYAVAAQADAHSPAPRTAFWSGTPATEEGYLLALLQRALYGSARDRKRADGAFCRILSGDQVWIHTRYYRVTGSTTDEIWDSMRRSAAVIADGDAVGSTQWTYRWKAVPELKLCGRETFNASLYARIVITLPEWKPQSSDSEDLSPAWNDFSHSLLYHEQGHQLIAEFTLSVLRLRLDQNARSPSPIPVSDVCAAVMRDYGDLDDRYDQVTRHGALQGAVFGD